MKDVQIYYDILKEKGKNYLDDKTSSIWFIPNGYNSLSNLLSKKKRNTFHLKNIEKIESEMPEVLFDNSNYIINSSPDRTGLFKFTFEEKEKEEYLFFLCYMNNLNEQIQMCYCSQELLGKVNKLLDKVAERQTKPRLGVFTGEISSTGVLKYIPHIKNISKKEIYHAIKEDVLKDLHYFFNNVTRSIENKEKGTRKILLAGVQGTGKSTFLNEVMLELKDTHSILICSEMKELVKHTQLCSKFSVPCIPILEDCENHLDDKNSNELNFLSGSLEPINKAGTYIIMTTNHPDRISDRVKHRPERIDEVYILSYLNREDANKVTKHYFSQFLPEDFNYTTLDGLFSSGDYSKTTGSEIMKYAQDVKKAANYEYGHFNSVTRKYIEKVLKIQKDKYQKLNEIDTKKTNISKQGNGFSNQVGFSSYVE